MFPSLVLFLCLAAVATTSVANSLGNLHLQWCLPIISLSYETRHDERRSHQNTAQGEEDEPDHLDLIETFVELVGGLVDDSHLLLVANISLHLWIVEAYAEHNTTGQHRSEPTDQNQNPQRGTMTTNHLSTLLQQTTYYRV